jgi:hypothetical protein
MPSIIFVTLTNGEYDDHWISEPNTLLADQDTAGHRQLHWCGQRKKTTRDHLVVPGTLVAVRKTKNTLEFTLVGTVATKTQLTSKVGRTPATYNLLVELSVEPRSIRRAAGDRCVHWTVLRNLNIPRSAGYLPEGIYSAPA